eukprot:scaffold51502_cov115-Phaeocystis_antarctica.AAC.1
MAGQATAAAGWATAVAARATAAAGWATAAAGWGVVAAGWGKTRSSACSFAIHPGKTLRPRLRTLARADWAAQDRQSGR